MIRVSRQQNIKRVAASLLAFWLSGAVFLFCCETSKAKVLEAESCPLAKTSHCGKKSTGANVSPFALLQAGDQTLDCCRFPAQVFDKARKLETNQQTAEIPATVKVSATKVLRVNTDFNFPQFYQSFVRNRGSTHLQNCVFRI